jgi:hypothetical protein
MLNRPLRDTLTVHILQSNDLVLTEVSKKCYLINYNLLFRKVKIGGNSRVQHTSMEWNKAFIKTLFKEVLYLDLCVSISSYAPN